MGQRVTMHEMAMLYIVLGPHWPNDFPAGCSNHPVPDGGATSHDIGV